VLPGREKLHPVTTEQSPQAVSFRRQAGPIVDLGVFPAQRGMLVDCANPKIGYANDSPNGKIGYANGKIDTVRHTANWKIDYVNLAVPDSRSARTSTRD
jgi:hypothetical protein